jgi:hypothetical protein
MEIVVTLGVISAEIWVFRWIINRMPVLDFSDADEEERAEMQAEPGRVPA